MMARCVRWNCLLPFFLFRLGLVCCLLDLFFPVPLHNCFVTTIKRLKGSLMCSPRFIFTFLCPPRPLLFYFDLYNIEKIKINKMSIYKSGSFERP